ncbi:MAG: hypothetical protein OSB70_15860 [Myxococcota bacterium]|nr:hypothetical protein [Myxococcota bacterium]
MLCRRAATIVSAGSSQGLTVSVYINYATEVMARSNVLGKTSPER